MNLEFLACVEGTERNDPQTPFLALLFSFYPWICPARSLVCMYVNTPAHICKLIRDTPQACGVVLSAWPDPGRTDLGTRPVEALEAGRRYIGEEFQGPSYLVYI